MKHLSLLILLLLMACEEDRGTVLTSSSSATNVNKAEKNYIYHRYTSPDIIREADFPKGAKRIHTQYQSNGSHSHTIRVFNKDGWEDSTYTFNEDGDTTFFTMEYEFSGDFLIKRTLSVNGIPNNKYDFEYNSEGFLVKDVLTSIMPNVVSTPMINEYSYEQIGDTTTCINIHAGNHFKTLYSVNNTLVKIVIPFNNTVEIYEENKLTVFNEEGDARQMFEYNEYGEVVMEDRQVGTGGIVTFTYPFRDDNGSWTLKETSNGNRYQRQITYH